MTLHENVEMRVHHLGFKEGALVVKPPPPSRTGSSRVFTRQTLLLECLEQAKV